MNLEMERKNQSLNHSTELFQRIENEMIRCLLVLLFIGVIGNLFSYLLLNEKQYRLNGISFLFRSASIFNMLVLIFGITTSIYSVNVVKLEEVSSIYCKLHLYIRHVLLMIVRSYIVLSCVASFCLTSNRLKYRSLFEKRKVKWYVKVVVMLWPLIGLHIALQTDLKKNKCVQMDEYVLVFGIYFFLIVGIIPVVLMILFILLTKKNLREMSRRIEPSIVNLNSIKLKNRDQQFLRMLFSLVLMYFITNLFYPANILYMSITNSLEKSEGRVQVESLILSITSNYILYINNVSPFFLFFISSKSFRRSFYQKLTQICSIEYFMNKIR